MVLPRRQQSLEHIIRGHLADERGALTKEAPFRIALAYPSPYHVGMSSLGFQQIYRLIQGEPGMCCERFFLPDDEISQPLSYESLQTLSSFPLVGFSVAYELEIAGLVRVLASSGIPPKRVDRNASHPLIIAGGPLTFSNPLPLSGYVDAIIMGEADTLAIEAFRALSHLKDRKEAIDHLASMPNVFVPEHHGAEMPGLAQCEDDVLPARSAIRTPNTELSDMFLLEAERGCSRGCKYCVMRRSTNGGMRIVPQERILELIPEDARKVGLVGAAVSDHPKIADIVRTLAERGTRVGLSSLRPDRLNDNFVGALKQAGYRTLTTAMDGPSERLRDLLDRRARPRHILKAAELVRAHQMKRLKLYLMVGLPGETDEDIVECASFVTELTRVAPVALGIAPFCSKRNTPLDGQPYAGVEVVQKRLRLLRTLLKGRADVRATSARWAWVEYVLAQGGEAEGLAVMDAVNMGGTFADYKKAFEAVAKSKPTKRRLAIAPN